MTSASGEGEHEGRHLELAVAFIHAEFLDELIKKRGWNGLSDTVRPIWIEGKAELRIPWMGVHSVITRCDVV